VAGVACRGVVVSLVAFTNAVISAVVRVAKANKIEPAALLAVVEVESSGVPFEHDGVTPRFLYERHVFYREVRKLRGKARAEAAIRAGLGRTNWNKAVQYSDQRSSPARLALMKKAKEFDEECACRSASWGLGQTMGFHAETQGFPNAIAFVEWMTKGGVDAQIEAMVKEIKKSGLVSKINAHDWAGFAYRYNGAGYAQNQYDSRMANAYRKWVTKLPTIRLEPEKPKPKNIPPPDIDPAPDHEPTDQPKGWFGTIWRKIMAGAGALASFTGITWLTDWMIAAAFFGFVLILIGLALWLFFYIYDAEDVRDWLKRKTGFGR
jgi:hypothetical protein